MKNAMISLKILNADEDISPTYQQVTCHMIFDANMEDFWRKALFVAGEHTADNPHAMMYVIVVSRKSVRIGLPLADLNNFDVKMADIESAHLTAPFTDKVWTVIGPEYGFDVGKRVLIVRSLYDLIYAGTAFIIYLAEYMAHLG
jgi:hypothetical protein